MPLEDKHITRPAGQAVPLEKYEKSARCISCISQVPRGSAAIRCPNMLFSRHRPGPEDIGGAATSISICHGAPSGVNCAMSAEKLFQFFVDSMPSMFLCLCSGHKFAEGRRLHWTVFQVLSFWEVSRRRSHSGQRRLRRCSTNFERSTGSFKTPCW